MTTNVDAYILREPDGVCRIMVKRAKYKHWFELGRHAKRMPLLNRRWPMVPSVGIRKSLIYQGFFEKYAKNMRKSFGN